MPIHLTATVTKEEVLRGLLSAANGTVETRDEKVIDLSEKRIIDLREQPVEPLDEQTIEPPPPILMPANGAYVRWGKRTLDLVLILIFLPFWGLLYVLIAAALAIAQGRPIHYKSTRVGWRGRELTVLKFRTMNTQADEELAMLLATDPALAREFTETVKLRRDPRVTRLGRWLRWASLDELPQLLNVVKGDMSLVGPRPVLRAEMDELYGLHATAITRFRPGLTGLWQISGRSLLAYSERVALDLRYTQTCSLWTDAYILLRTLPCVLRGDGAY